MKVVEQPEGRTVHTAGKEPMPKRAAVKAATPAAKVAAPRPKRRRIDPVGKYMLDNEGVLGPDHKLDY